jgi:hypothetical protein
MGAAVGALVAERTSVSDALSATGVELAAGAPEAGAG